MDDLNLKEKPHPASYEQLGFPEVRRQAVHFPLHCTVDILPTLHTPHLYVNDKLPNAETEMKQKMEFFFTLQYVGLHETAIPNETKYLSKNYYHF